MNIFSSKGQGLIEYLILTCLIAVSAIWVVSTVGKNIAEQYANISRALTKGDGQSVQRTEADEASYRGRGMGDYMEGARKDGAHGRH
jgi:Flp pilus assembly pilin Flp